MGYHLRTIEKGTLGEFSKIREEFEELEDAIKQENKVLQICELCDMMGAIEAFIAKNNLTLNDIIQMNERTKSAFQSGDRT